MTGTNDESVSRLLGDLSDDWSRPRLISRVFEAIGEEPPERLRAERFRGLVVWLRERGIEACLADDPDSRPLADDVESPGIIAKVRLRRKSAGSTAHRSVGRHRRDGAERLFGKYEVLRRLKPGAMGEAFKVREVETGAVRFIKRVRNGSGDAARLKREAQIYNKLANYDCSHVVAVHSVERDAEYTGLVLDFADGGTLEDFVGARALPTTTAKDIAVQVGTGIAELHELEIVHRDIKPGNVLRDSRRWKLADFGISRDTRVQATTTFRGDHTRGYAAPEQVNSTEANKRADIYSFGKVMAFTLTRGTDPDRVPYDSWRYLIHRCTERDPTLRPSAKEVLAELKALVP